MPLITFRRFAAVVTVACFGLAAVWLLAPQLLLGMWGVEHSEAVGLVGRRAAALYLGIGAMFFFCRSAPSSPARDGLLAGFAIGCVVLAALGLFELVMERVSAGIFLAVVTEVLLAAGCAHVVRTSEQHQGPGTSLNSPA